MSRTSKKQSEQPLPSAPEKLLDVDGAAAWFGVSRAKLFELMHEEGFPVIIIPNRVIRFDPNSLYRWSLERQVNGRYVA